MRQLILFLFVLTGFGCKDRTPISFVDAAILDFKRLTADVGDLTLNSPVSFFDLPNGSAESDGPMIHYFVTRCQHEQCVIGLASEDTDLLIGSLDVACNVPYGVGNEQAEIKVYIFVKPLEVERVSSAVGDCMQYEIREIGEAQMRAGGMRVLRTSQDVEP